MTTMMIVLMGAKMMNDKKEIRRGDSLIVNYDEIKLEKFDTRPTVFEIAKILEKQLPIVKTTKIFQNLDFVNRYRIELMFHKPTITLTNCKIEGIALLVSGLRKGTIEENAMSWKKVTPKD